jgi:succinylglutamate desuccinylase
MTSGIIRRVAIVGGTHGNELTGVYLIRKYQRLPALVQRASLSVMTLLANPEAVRLNRRYVDRDLNRCFTETDLTDDATAVYEVRRAQEIATQLCPSDDGQSPQSGVDFIIDLHSTTANMGMTIIPSSQDPFNLKLVAYLSSLDPEIKVCFGQQYGAAAPMLRSLTAWGCTIEVGPVAQGVMDAALIQKTERLIQAVLDYLDSTNYQQLPTLPPMLTMYQAIASVDYPRNADGEVEAVIHPRLQAQDYQPLYPGDPMFLMMTGEVICYEGETVVYPVFVNEAAYYEKNMALILTEKRSVLL